MSERARLVEIIVFDEPCTRDQHLSAVQDLLSLCQKNFEVMYRPENELINELCSVCDIQLPTKAKDRPDHIHNCRRSQMTKRINEQSLLNESIQVQYCYLCFSWFQKTIIWKKHCCKHLLSMNFVWCGIQKYCHTVISLEYCSFCMSNENLSASKRLQAWTRNYLLMKHLNKHIKNLCLFYLICPHSLCDAQVDTLDLFRYHLVDIHDLTMLQWNAFDAQREMDEKRDEVMTTSLNRKSTKSRAMRRKRSNANDETEPTFVCWSSPDSKIHQQSIARRITSPKLNFHKRRKLNQEFIDLDAIFSEKSHSASLSATDSISHVDMQLQVCLELNSKDSCFSFNSEGDQIARSPTSSMRLYHDFEMISISIDSVLISLNDSSASDAFTHQEEADASHTPLATEANISLAIDSLVCPAVVTNDQAPCSLVEDMRAIQIDNQLWNSRGTSIFQRDTEYQLSLQSSNDREKGKKALSIFRFAHEKPTRNLDKSKASANDLFTKCSLCQCDVSWLSRVKSKPMTFRQQEKFCQDHQIRNAETEWTQLRYSRIAWRRLHLRLTQKSSTIRDIIDENSSSFFCRILQAAVDRKKAHKYRCIENMTAGYYDSRGQQIM